MNRLRVARELLRLAGELVRDKKESDVPKPKLQLQAKRDEWTTVSFRVKGDARFSIPEMLQYISKIGAWGHSFPVTVDPDDSGYRKTFGFDGDGSDRIEDIRVDGKPAIFEET